MASVMEDIHGRRCDLAEVMSRDSMRAQTIETKPLLSFLNISFSNVKKR